MKRLGQVCGVMMLLLSMASPGLGQDRSYKVLATSKTSTMQKEMQEAGAGGYQAIGLTVGKTAIGGNELVVISRRKAR